MLIRNFFRQFVIFVTRRVVFVNIVAYLVLYFILYFAFVIYLTSFCAL